MADARDVGRKGDFAVLNHPQELAERRREVGKLVR